MNPETLRDLLARTIVADTHDELRQCVIDCVKIMLDEAIGDGIDPRERSHTDRVKASLLRWERDRMRKR